MDGRDSVFVKIGVVALMVPISDIDSVPTNCNYCCMNGFFCVILLDFWHALQGLKLHNFPLTDNEKGSVTLS